MWNRSWLLALAMAALFVAPRTVDANHLDSTSWTLSGVDKVKIRGVKPIRTTIPSASLVVDAASHFAASGAPVDYTGTYVDKRRPRGGFKATADASSVSDIQNLLVVAVKNATGATSVNVKRIKVRISGALSKDGQTIKVATKITMSGTARIHGRRWGGTVTETGSFTGHPRS